MEANKRKQIKVCLVQVEIKVVIIGMILHGIIVFLMSYDDCYILKLNLNFVL
ncbi:hypothetical protein Fmac_033034 [Flemingia macrophylla]|uniref:Uncharacterized protein n=1 Tax=Flemingia macrophylla TaxID=520843 RepID=A0ABD1L720_9FABA